MSALHAGRQVKLHVVAQVIEAELVVRAVGDVRGVGCLPLKVVHVVLNAADFAAEKAMNLSHPLSVARGQIVIDGDDVNAAATRQSVEIRWNGGDEHLTCTRSHLAK